ncbi:MAG: 60 kDa SS-A/Ro ribonucleoprotein [Maribacter sp.]|jgi:60 kDa SS-A/Ro ribonucleoprotein
MNLAGGEAYKQSPKMQLASIMLTSFAQDQFYRNAKDTFKDLVKLLAQVDPKFAAQAAIYARTKFNMRSITHVLAAELAAYASGQTWSKEFYAQIVSRPDDMLEIVAYYFNKGGKTIPNAMKKGFAAAFDKFDGYQIAKYRGENREVKLVDLVNLIHPVPTQRNAKALQELVNGTLRNTNTWEAKLTKAGQVAETAEDKAEKKAAAWNDLIATNKLGYFALLRNLRNIAEQAPNILDKALATLIDRDRIKKSKVLPFRFLSALDAINEANINNKYSRKIQKALNDAIETSLDNVPVFEGKTLVVLDDSGSMTWGGGKDKKTPIQIGAIFAAMLYKSNDADLMRFSDNASFAKPYFGDAAMTIADGLINNAKSAGTNFHAIFKTAKKSYNRIIILSDMQGWIGGYSPKKEFDAYKKRTGADPYIYSFDLNSYGSLQFPESKVFALAGFSDKVFDLMALLETDRNALVLEIEKVEI